MGESFRVAPAGLGPRDDDDEGLFSRDINGQLVRLDAPLEADYDKKVTLQIDGQTITVPLAQPLTDAQNNVILDAEGRSTPRYTTIYDAAMKLHGNEASKIPIPVLCHQAHMRPVAVCRMCVVQIYGQKRGKRAAERKLLPACQHQVKEGMEVFTMNAPGEDGERVRRSAGVLAELLGGDHLRAAPASAPPAQEAFNELKVMTDRLGVGVFRFRSDLMADPARQVPRGPAAGPGATAAPFPPAPRRLMDGSSPVFVVDHDACILCDRCARACDEVKENNVIGRTGKGATAGIGFDLNDPMGDSSCVRCGECMVSCPTTAISFKSVKQVKLKGARDAEVVPAMELFDDPMFEGVPRMFLLWQEGLVVRRRVKQGEFLCRAGDPGNTAFLIKSGEFDIIPRDPSMARPEKRGFLSRLTVRGQPPAPPTKKPPRLTPKDFIVGEMACISGTARTADVVAASDGEVLEVRRNVLDRLMRLPKHKERFEKLYRERAVDAALRSSELFAKLPKEEFDACVEYLGKRLSFVRVRKDQVIFRQGDWADDFYLVRLGHVRVGISREGEEVTMLYRGPGAVLGEIGLLAISPDDVAKDPDAVDAALGQALSDATDEAITSALPAGRRTATCSALDDLELARLTRADFLRMLRKFSTVRRRLVQMALQRILHDFDNHPAMREYVEQGLYQGQSLLLLDLTRCTQCGECVRACEQQHGTASHGMPITRLLLEGRQFGDYMVARSCRSCKDAYCMVGCPVDSIHRGRHLQIVIEDHCIGCGLCAENCPYDNIFMPENLKAATELAVSGAPAGGVAEAAGDDGGAGAGGAARAQVRQPKAATCDLCDAEGLREEPLPRCVYACPHDAAHRMTGEQLLDLTIKADTIG